MVTILQGEEAQAHDDVEACNKLISAILAMFAHYQVDAQVGLNTALNLFAMSFHSYAKAGDMTEAAALAEFDEVLEGLREGFKENWNNPPAVAMARVKPS